MYADAKHDPALRRQTLVALNHAVLHFNGAAHRIHRAPKLHNGSVAGALDDAAVVHRNYGINQIAAKSPKPRQSAFFVRAREPAVTDHVRDEDYFERSTRTPIHPVTVLSNAQREALRPLCGPRPSAPAHQRAGH